MYYKLYFPVLTQQYDGTQEDGDESSSAETRRAAQSLSVAQLHVAFTVTGAHPHSESAGAALHGIVAIGNHHRNQVDALVKEAVAGSTCQDASSVIWEGESIIVACMQCTVCLTLCQTAACELKTLYYQVGKKNVGCTSQKSFVVSH